MKRNIVRKYNKKNIAILIAILTIVVILIFTILKFMEKDDAVFYIDGKEMKEYEVTVEYGEEFSLLPKDLKMDVKTVEDKSLLDKVTYETQSLDKLGSYKITYTVEDESIQKSTFTLVVKIEDKTPPTFLGPNEIQWKLKEPFDYSAESHDISATDVYDKDLNERITYEGNVDTSNEGTYEVIYIVEDSSKNQAKHVLQVNVKDERVVAASADDLYKDPRSITPTIINPNRVEVLVNKYHAIPDGWEPNDLVSITSNSGRDMYLRSEAASAWEELNAAAKAEGITIQVISSFRTASYQANLFQNYYASDGANAFLYSALSRRSEHELGLAIDVSYDGQLHEDLLNSNVGQFMNDEGYKYGFVLRYPNEKINVTGYGFEAWHYRYVGKGLAKELKSKNIVLEEY